MYKNRTSVTEKYLENPPQDSTEQWSDRPFRAFTIVLNDGSCPCRLHSPADIV